MPRKTDNWISGSIPDNSGYPRSWDASGADSGFIPLFNSDAYGQSVFGPPPKKRGGPDFGEFRKCAGLSSRELVTRYPGLFVFPPNPTAETGLSISPDDFIFRIVEDKNGVECLQTGNYMGFLGWQGDGEKQVSLTITSRFARDNYFLFYLLQKVLNYNVVSWETSADMTTEAIDLLSIMFPRRLEQALQQGLYREYRFFDRNDGNLTGEIDISRYVSEDIPFRGSIACRTREFAFDNKVTQLIRHTIEFLGTRTFFRKFIQSSTSGIAQAVSKITAATDETYNAFARAKIIALNSRPFSHPYFSAYRPLVDLCLKILRHDRMAYGDSKNDSLQGVLFDGAFLWEEYLWTILRKYDTELVHSKNKAGSGGFRPFEGGEYTANWYPDFYKEGEFVMDAKYKRLGNGVSASDLHQMVSYMHLLNAKKGILIHPENTESASFDGNIGTLYNHADETMGRVAFPVPTIEGEETYGEFCNKMKNAETKLIDRMNAELRNGF